MDSRKRKNWSDYDLGSSEYLNGLTKFIKYAFEKAPSEDKTIACPCSRCVRYHRGNEKDVYDHLVIKGPMRDFEKWYNDFDCESISGQNANIGAHNSMVEMLGDAYGIHRIATGETRRTHDEDSNLIVHNQLDQNVHIREEPSESCPSDIEMFNTLLKDAEVELYPGCKEYSKLSFVLHLYNIKCNFGWSDKSFGELLEIFKKALPQGATIPDSLYETKKIVDKLTLKYEKIDACLNDCMLYWKENAHYNECTVCGSSRWKFSREESSENVSTSQVKKRKTNKIKKTPVKVMWYFPLKPRLQRLFMSCKTAELMRWHDKDREKEDGVLRHPADSEAWKNFDARYPSFAADPRNIRLGLASDGFNPFAEMRSTYSTWPVLLTIYNLPPWLCMKKSYIILSTLIQGPKSPGNDIDTYLQPLICELKELWEVGVETFDAFEKKFFRLHASLCWTINDFPAYGNLSGWCVYGKNACPCCNNDKWSKRYKNSGKVCYMGHRRFLSATHRFRNDKKSFDNTKEVRLAPKPPSGIMILEQLKHIKFTLGKTTQDDLSGVDKNTWKKKSIFFNLPYWEHNMLRHNLDVMHIEKNVCDNIINTILNVPEKSKDNLKARQTLKEMGVRKHLWPEPKNGKFYLPPAPYSLSKQAKDRFCEVLQSVKFPDGYASNISRCVHTRKLSGLKSHDCHVLMQLMMPLAVRECLNEKVASILIELCDFFRALCSKTLYISELDRLEIKIATILCNLEKLFPPTFFTIMVHLVVHLAAEARIGGPVQYRWMYPIERFLSTLKSYVGNKARPEGSIAETYLIQECITFCSRYLEGGEDIRNRSMRNNAHSTVDLENGQKSRLFLPVGQHYGRVEAFMMDEMTSTQAHRYVLFNCDCKEIELLREEHISFLKRIHRRSRPSQHVIDRMHNEEFIEWLKKFVNDPDNLTNIGITEDVKLLAQGPLPIARRFQAFDMKNGYRFRTKEYEKNKNTQNSGVKVVAKTQSYASSKDKNPILGDVIYYGILTDIIELNFYGNFKIPMFRCDWVNVHNVCGFKKDKLGFTLVNFSHLIHNGDRISDEPFVFASQVDQVIYIQDRAQQGWFIPRSIKPRGTFDLQDDNLEADFDIDEDFQLTAIEDNFDIDIDDSAGLEGTYVDK